MPRRSRHFSDRQRRPVARACQRCTGSTKPDGSVRPAVEHRGHAVALLGVLQLGILRASRFRAGSPPSPAIRRVLIGGQDASGSPAQLGPRSRQQAPGLFGANAGLGALGGDQVGVRQIGCHRVRQ
jgi:hypothetical protein